MSKWRVYNRHPHGLTHKEKFKGDDLEIKAGEYILMDYEDAVQFKGQYFPMKMDPQGVQDPKSYKVIEIKPDTAEALPLVKERFICQKDGKEFETKAELDAYTKANFDGQQFIDETIEKEIAKRGPGRPPKEKSA